jgi:hypothetical protein
MSPFRTPRIAATAAAPSPRLIEAQYHVAAVVAVDEHAQGCVEQPQGVVSEHSFGERVVADQMAGVDSTRRGSRRSSRFTVATAGMAASDTVSTPSSEVRRRPRPFAPP